MADYGKLAIDALMWPVKDIPRIFAIGTTGFQPAIPALVEVGAVATLLVARPVGTKWEVVDIALAYGAATAASFVLVGIMKL